MKTFFRFLLPLILYVVQSYSQNRVDHHYIYPYNGQRPQVMSRLYDSLGREFVAGTGGGVPFNPDSVYIISANWKFSGSLVKFLHDVQIGQLNLIDSAVDGARLNFYSITGSPEIWQIKNNGSQLIFTDIESGETIFEIAPTIIYCDKPIFVQNSCAILAGAGSPSGVVSPGSIYLRSNGGNDSTVYTYGSSGWELLTKNVIPDSVFNYSLSVTTSGAVQTEMFQSNGARINIPAGQSWHVSYQAILNNHDGTHDFATYFLTDGDIQNVGGTILANVGATTGNSNNSTGAKSFTVDGDNTNKALRFRVTGVAGQTISWLVRVQVVKLTF